MIKYITSRKNEIVKKTIDLKNSKTQNNEKKFIIEGEHLLEMANKANNICYVITSKHINYINQDIDQYIVTEDILNKISSQKSAPSVIAICSFVNENVDEEKNLIYLDKVQDPGNVGTILRTALAFSFFNVLISNDSANKYNEKTIQASQGAIFNLNIKTIDYSYIKKLKTVGYKIVVTTLNKDSIKLNNFKLKNDEKYVFVFGSEGKGVRQEIIDLADIKVFIEINNIDSLNVGIAAGIFLYNFRN